MNNSKGTLATIYIMNGFEAAARESNNKHEKSPLIGGLVRSVQADSPNACGLIGMHRAK